MCCPFFTEPAPPKWVARGTPSAVTVCLLVEIY
ncbi:Uncharacterised protein [Bordetella pertussis]|nr:Uncharacterised protein [Bordetella pertussis]